MRKNFSPANNFRTKDFWLAAALSAANCYITNLEWNGRDAFFVFDVNSNAEELSNEYWSGKLKVSAKGMTDALRTLKDRLHSSKPHNG